MGALSYLALSAVLAVWSRPGPAGMASVAAWPSAWGGSCSTAYEAPAGISRIEGIEISSTYSDAAARSALLGAGTRVGPVYAALGLDWVGEPGEPPAGGADPVSATIACAWVATGDPVGFIEGFFGPCIAIGASCRASSGGIDGDAVLGSAGVQFAVFPTFALGVSIVDLPAYTSEDAGTEAETHWGGTYIFSREFRVHASASGEGASLGAELAVTPWLSARTGSSGDSWNAGASVDVGAFTLDYAVILDDSSAGHVVSLGCKLGGENWY